MTCPSTRRSRSTCVFLPYRLRVMAAGDDTQDYEREALFFAVLRERVRPREVGSPVLPAATEKEIERRLSDAEVEISTWLDEAEEEGTRILERARSEAARLRNEAHAQAERFRQAAERASGDADRDRDRIMRDAELASSRVQAEASARASAVMDEAELIAARRRRQAAEEASALLAETRAAAERRIESAEQEADWVKAQADATARATRQRAEATVLALQSDVVRLQHDLTRLVDQAMRLLPSLDAAAQSLSQPVTEVTAGQDGRLQPAPANALDSQTSTAAVGATARSVPEHPEGPARRGGRDAEPEPEDAPSDPDEGALHTDRPGSALPGADQDLADEPDPPPTGEPIDVDDADDEDEPEPEDERRPISDGEPGERRGVAGLVGHRDGANATQTDAAGADDDAGDDGADAEDRQPEAEPVAAGRRGLGRLLRRS